eukprot:GFUD01033421.1.p1 GENE.GFUD01033421.1~~GFUD01033421.1.p1  ORF type:complete len:153 (-),score=34.43 GFUD01033421.1:112-570(-)
MIVTKYLLSSILIGWGGLAAGKGYHCSVNTGRVTTVQGPVTYSSQTLASGPGDINPRTGQFSAPNDGIYTIAYGLGADNNAGDRKVQVWVRKNRQEIPGTRHTSFYTGQSAGVYDQGGRTMIVQLAKGDNIDLYCRDCSPTIRNISFCITEE